MNKGKQSWRRKMKRRAKKQRRRDTQVERMVNAAVARAEEPAKHLRLVVDRLRGMMQADLRRRVYGKPRDGRYARVSALLRKARSDLAAAEEAAKTARFEADLFLGANHV